MTDIQSIVDYLRGLAMDMGQMEVSDIQDTLIGYADDLEAGLNDS